MIGSIEHGALIVGAGVAGLWAAIEAYDAGLRGVAVISKVHPLRSHSVAAQGGIAAPIGNVRVPPGGDAASPLVPAPEGGAADSAERLVADTIKSSDWLGDHDAIEILAAEAAGTLFAYERLGCTFDRLPDGRIAQRRFAGHSAPRAAYAADRTGHALLITLYDQLLKRDIPVYDEHFVLDLIFDGGAARGVVALDVATGELRAFTAPAVLLATGGFAGVYAVSSNALINTGDGAALVAQSGLPLMDMELVQFHPTGLYGHGVLISEACRAEGGHLRNARGERFMERYSPSAMELAPRDIVSRAEQQEIDEGRGHGPDGQGLWLDLTHLGEATIAAKLPEVAELARKLAGADPARDPIPIQPTAHYTMGGIPTDLDGRVLDAAGAVVPGLFAAGECACVSVHGANRLGANSLMEASVYGRRAGRALAAAAIGAEGGSIQASTGAASAVAGGPTNASIQPSSGVRASAAVAASALTAARARLACRFEPPGAAPPRSAFELTARVRATMTATCGILRDEAGLTLGAAEIAALAAELTDLRVHDTGRIHNAEIVRSFEAENMIVVAAAVAASALERRESRGAHARRDYPARDDDRWLRHILVRRDGARHEIAYRPVRIDWTRHPPAARKY